MGAFTEEGMVEIKAIFEGGFKFAYSEASKKFDSRSSAHQGAIGEISGSDWGASG